MCVFVYCLDSTRRPLSRSLLHQRASVCALSSLCVAWCAECACVSLQARSMSEFAHGECSNVPTTQIQRIVQALSTAKRMSDSSMDLGMRLALVDIGDGSACD